MSNPDQNYILTDSDKEHHIPVKNVMLINAYAGNQITDPSQYPAQIQRQTLIDMGECLELLEAVVTGDISELRDGLADKQVTLAGFANILPFSLSKDFDHTVLNLLTRFDYTIENALATKQKYADLGVETYIEANITAFDGKTELAYVNKVKEASTDINGEFYPAGKFVKSVNYINDDFEAEGQGVLLPTDLASQEERYLALRKPLANWLAKMDQQYLEVKE